MKGKRLISASLGPMNREMRDLICNAEDYFIDGRSCYVDARRYESEHLKQTRERVYDKKGRRAAATDFAIAGEALRDFLEESSNVTNRKVPDEVMEDVTKAIVRLKRLEIWVTNGVKDLRPSSRYL